MQQHITRFSYSWAFVDTCHSQPQPDDRQESAGAVLSSAAEAQQRAGWLGPLAALLAAVEDRVQARCAGRIGLRPALLTMLLCVMVAWISSITASRLCIPRTAYNVC
jgi:hypothetical protein